MPVDRCRSSVRLRTVGEETKELVGQRFGVLMIFSRCNEGTVGLISKRHSLARRK